MTGVPFAVAAPLASRHWPLMVIRPVSVVDHR